MNDVTDNKIDWDAMLKDLETNRIMGIIESRDDNKVYVSDFKDGRGKYINMYIKEEPDNFQVSKQIQISLTYIKQSEKVTGLKLTKVKNGIEDGVINLTLDGITKLLGISNFLTSIDIPMLSTQKITLQDDLNINLDVDAKSKIKTAFSDESNKGFLLELISQTDIHDAIKTMFTNTESKNILVDHIKSGLITDYDIVNMGYRKEQLNKFEQMLVACDDEKQWQKFFEQNQWIFGFGLDYKFNQILQREFSTGSQGLDDKGDSHGDFILSDSKFAVLVELKTPNTILFGSDKYRNGCWRISTDLADVTSQILSQKHEVSLNFDRLNQDNDNDVDLYDPKAIIVIGHTKQFNSDDKKESRWKKRTFELYRRNLRNVEIMTYDELYSRAKFIVENSK